MNRFLIVGLITFLFDQCSDPGSNSGCGSINPQLWTESATTSILVRNSVCNNGSGILFKKVLSDSRCPEDVNCIWEGEIRIQLEIFSEADTIGTIELSSKETTSEVTVAEHRYLMTMKRVEPYPNSTEQIDPKSYIVTLAVDLKEE